MRCLQSVLILLCLSLSLPFAVFAQNVGKPSGKAEPEVEANDNTAPPPISDSQVRRLSMLNDSELRLSLEVLLFGVIVLILEFLLLRKSVVHAEDTLRVYGVTMILIGTLFAITAGFKSQDVAPAMGLFGTIAGYLLGKRNSTTNTPAAKDDKPDKSAEGDLK